MSRGRVRVLAHEAGNAYMTEIGELLASGFRAHGLAAELVGSGIPDPDPGAYDLVVAPHEYLLFEGTIDPVAALDLARRAAVLNTEQPGTQWFDLALDHCSVSPLVFDLNPVGCAALRRSGISAEELRLGYTPEWDLLGGDFGAGRPVDVVFLGASTTWRERVVARLAEALSERTCRLHFFDNSRPATDQEGFLTGRPKLELLASSRILLNVHRAGTGHYFEWHRCLPALMNGAVLVTEPSASSEPLEPFADFVPVEVDAIEGYLVALLDDEPRRAAMARHAYDTIRSRRRLDTSIAAATGCLRERFDDQPASSAARRRARGPAAASTVVAAQVRDRLGSRITNNGPTGLEADPYDPLARVAHGVKRILLEQRKLTSALERVLRAAGEGITEPLVVTSACFDAIRPDVSVVVPLFNHGEFVVAAIDSALHSLDVAVEVVVVDDGSTDDSAAIVADAVRARPWARLKLVRHPENRGLAAARNTGFEHATCEAVFLLDADNELYPEGLARLVRALGAAGDDAGFAYGVLATFGDEERLVSHYPWDVTQLCRRNYVDAMALVRKELWARLGGYTSGPNDVAYGWEDYLFWLRCADAGVRPVAVPELVGRYRVRHGSMISITGIETSSVEEYLHRTFPALPWPQSVAPDEVSV